MTCGGCGNPNAIRTRSGAGWEYCNVCGDVGNKALCDVYWDGKEEHGLPDDPKTGKPRVFGSKMEKAMFLRANNLVEAGDRMGGSHATILRDAPQRDNPREAAMKALAFVKNMGRDVRRQEYLRIQKEQRR